MAGKLDALRLKLEQGERVKRVRDALGQSQDAFAETLGQAVQQAVGLKAQYGKSKLSKMEGGERKITAEEAVVIADLDPDKRGARWLVFGPKRQRGALLDDPRKAMGRGGDGRKEA